MGLVTTSNVYKMYNVICYIWCLFAYPILDFIALYFSGIVVVILEDVHTTCSLSLQKFQLGYWKLKVF